MEEKDNNDVDINSSEKTKETTENEKENVKEKEKKENSNSEDLLTLIKSLNDFELYLKSLKSIYSILTQENLSFLSKLSLKENIKINLLLSKIYMIIISNESLYNKYLISIPENDTYKIDILFQLIENCISITEKLNSFVFSSDLYEFKNKILDLIKCIYYNCKTKIKEEEKLNKITELMETLPLKFYSNSFLELNKSKESYEVYKSEDIEKINDFEEKFSEINNYYEQYDAFKKFIENNSGIVNCSSIDNESIGKKTENIEFKADSDKIEFYEQYGSLILKFCKYHNYMFLDKEAEEENKEKEETEDSEEDNENTRVIFLLDKGNKENSEEETDKSKKIENILRNKQFVSSVDSKEYKELIKKEINNYLKTTKNLENEEKIKTVREHLNYYLSTLDVESYYPLYLSDFTKVTISDNFTPSFVTNVPAGGTNKFYFETPENQDTLVYIEWSLEDQSKDINFEINKYEIGNNEFMPAFKEEKIENKLKLFVVCHGYSLYEIIFDNSYSWFNSKDVNYRISLLKLSDKSESEETSKDENEQKNEFEYEYEINGKKYHFNEKNKKKVKQEGNEINIPVILYLNNIKFVSFKKNEKDKNEDELIFKDHIEEDETIIPKHLFNYLLIGHFKKKKIDKNKKIIISIFSQNRDLLSTCEELNEDMKNANNDQQKKYITNIGFIPDDKIDNYTLEYKLYDINEQILIYHVLSNIRNRNKISIDSVLLIQFDKLVANAIIYNQGQFVTKFKDKDKDINIIHIGNIDELLNIIKYANNTYENIKVILSKNSNLEEENKKKLIDMIEKIKIYCQETIIPAIKIFEYEQNDICFNTIKYINSFYES